MPIAGMRTYRADSSCDIIGRSLHANSGEKNLENLRETFNFPVFFDFPVMASNNDIGAVHRVALITVGETERRETYRHRKHTHP